VRHPIPDEALDDRLAVVGTSGSGKTYAVMGLIERLLTSGARVITVDALGVMWGLRLMADGKTPSPWRIPIFGGPRADVALTENAGAVIGETVATMGESCIVSLNGMRSKAAMRRFMLDFLTALEDKANGEPVHIILDEADLWAPQKIKDNEGGAAPRLLGQVESIVRRGRVKGFIPWLITQRPAVISKDVLSQADGLIAMKLTSSQDRDQLGGWVEGNADAGDWKRIRAELATLERGRGVLWIPGRRMLETVTFPEKKSFDSSRTPKRGEKKTSAATLKPLDVGALQTRLAAVEKEAKENDPKALKAQIAKLLAAQRPAVEVGTSELLEKARIAGFGAGVAHIAGAFLTETSDLDPTLVEAVAGAIDAHKAQIVKALTLHLRDVVRRVTPRAGARPPVATAHSQGGVDAPSRVERLKSIAGEPMNILAASVAAPRTMTKTAHVADGLNNAQQRILDALSWLEAVARSPADRTLVAFMSDASPSSSTFGINLGKLRDMGAIDYHSGAVTLTSAGRGMANVVVRPGTNDEYHGMIKRRLNTAQARILDVMIAADGKPIERAKLASLTFASPTSSTFGMNLGRLKDLGLIKYAPPGFVDAADTLFI
jgi:hypothetical protein